MLDLSGSKLASASASSQSDVKREDGSRKSAEVQAVTGTRSTSVGGWKKSTIMLIIISLSDVIFYNLLCSLVCSGLPENEDSSDVQDIIESTPELDLDLIGYKPCR